MNDNQPEASSSKRPFLPSPSTSSSTSSSSSSSSSRHKSPLEADKEGPHGSPEYSFYQHTSHTDSTMPRHPLEPTTPISSAPTLREPPLPDLIPPSRPTLAQFRASEGPATRAAKLHALWEALPHLPKIGEGPSALQKMRLPGQDTMTALSPERIERLGKLYEEELVRRVNEERPSASLWGGPDEASIEDILDKGVEFADFRRFLWDQESQLWDIFQDIDKNGDGRLDANEMRSALSRSGIDITPTTVNDLVRFLASGSDPSRRGKDGGKITPAVEDMYITFQEFRDFLIMLPRKATPFEIFKFYQVRKRFSDGRGAARVDKEGDISISFPKRPSPDDEDDKVDEEPPERHEAWRFLLAGGLAGADRNATSAGLKHPLKVTTTAVKNLWTAVTQIYQSGGGVRAFWVGNGLNVTKILPESAIKFYSYEQSKVFLAKYWDKVSDPSKISSSSRFFAGGIGGITSQFAIYGLETLKTRIQSEVGPSSGMKGVNRVMRAMWKEGGIRCYYRGLTLGLIGVFPYSAIDMGTYETLKNAYCRSRGVDEPEVFATLTFGAMSGSIGAASVYPINLLRTRLQASGSSGHPHNYTGFRDVLTQTLQREGWRGLYKGLLPSILKVGPAVGVSWIVYEDAKRRLGV